MTDVDGLFLGVDAGTSAIRVQPGAAGRERRDAVAAWARAALERISTA